MQKKTADCAEQSAVLLCMDSVTNEISERKMAEPQDGTD